MCIATEMTKQTTELIKLQSTPKESLLSSIEQPSASSDEDALVSSSSSSATTGEIKKQRFPLNHQPTSKESEDTTITQNQVLVPFSTPKRVTFCQQARVRRVGSWKNYTDDELADSWYSQAEYKLIRHLCCQDVLKTEKGEDVACFRGLECHTKLGRSNRTENKVRSFVAVLEEQEAQWEAAEDEGGSAADEDDEEAIALAYRQVSISCQLEANKIAIADWQAAKEYYDLEPTTALPSQKPCPRSNTHHLPQQTLSPPTGRPKPQCTWAKSA